MVIWKRTLLALLSLGLLVGCSSSPDVNPDVGLTPVAGQAVSQTTASGEEVAAAGASGSSQGTISTTIVDENGVEIESTPETTKPSEPQTKMNIEDGVDRMFQNGPSKEEIKRYTREPKKRTYKYNNEGDSGAPLYDANMEAIL